MIALPIGGGAAATGIAAAEAAEATAGVTGIVAAEATSAATSVACPVQEVAKDKTGPETATTSSSASAAGAEQGPEDEEAEENRNPGNVLMVLDGARARVRRGSGGCEIDILRFCDDFADGLRGHQHRGAVVAGPEVGAHVLQQEAVEAIGKKLFESVADFEAATVVVGDEQQQDAVIFPFLADAPGVKEVVGDVFDRVASKGGDGDEGELRGGEFFNLRGVGFE